MLANDIMSPNPLEKMLTQGKGPSRKRKHATKRINKNRKINMKNDGELVQRISFSILMKQDNDQDASHKEQVKMLMQLVGIGDDIDVGDP